MQQPVRYAFSASLESANTIPFAFSIYTIHELSSKDLKQRLVKER